MQNNSSIQGLKTPRGGVDTILNLNFIDLSMYNYTYFHSKKDYIRDSFYYFKRTRHEVS